MIYKYKMDSGDKPQYNTTFNFSENYINPDKSGLSEFKYNGTIFTNQTFKMYEKINNLLL